MPKRILARRPKTPPNDPLKRPIRRLRNFFIRNGQEPEIIVEPNGLLIKTQETREVVEDSGFNIEETHQLPGHYFIPNYSLGFVMMHPKILLEKNVQWKAKESFMKGEQYRYYSGRVPSAKGRTKNGQPTERPRKTVFRKDYILRDRSQRTRPLGEPLAIAEARNSTIFGDSKPIKINDEVSFRIPKYYAATPHGVLLERIDRPTFNEFVDKLPEKDKGRVKENYRQLLNFLKDKKNYGGAFWIPLKPPNSSRAGVRQVYIDSYNRKTGETKFIITDLKK
ncbi:MAG: hypothetical protein V1494_03885 [Candidatus Diapherotrites archaeon]